MSEKEALYVSDLRVEYDASPFSFEDDDEVAFLTSQSDISLWESFVLIP